MQKTNEMFLKLITLILFGGFPTGCYESLAAAADEEESGQTDTTESSDESSDKSSDNETEAETDSQSEIDTETQTQSDTQTEDVALFSGSYHGAYSGAMNQQLTLTVTDDGSFFGIVKLAAGAQTAVSSHIEAQGDMTFTVTGEENWVAYSGQFRLEGNNGFVFGSWGSDPASSGSWGAWRSDNSPDPDAAGIKPICEKLVTHCPDMTLLHHCIESTVCQAGYLASKSAVCGRLFYDDFFNELAKVESSADCPDFNGDFRPESWQQNDCPNPFQACAPTDEVNVTLR